MNISEVRKRDVGTSTGGVEREVIIQIGHDGLPKQSGAALAVQSFKAHSVILDTSVLYSASRLFKRIADYYPKECRHEIMQKIDPEGCKGTGAYSNGYNDISSVISDIAFYTFLVGSTLQVILYLAKVKVSPEVSEKVKYFNILSFFIFLALLTGNLTL